MPDFEYLHAEWKKPGVTLQLLHLEYVQKYADGYRYTAFCKRYRELLKRARSHDAQGALRRRAVLVRVGLR